MADSTGNPSNMDVGKGNNGIASTTDPGGDADKQAFSATNMDTGHANPKIEPASSYAVNSSDDPQKKEATSSSLDSSKEKEGDDDSHAAKPPSTQLLKDENGNVPDMKRLTVERAL